MRILFALCATITLLCCGFVSSAKAGCSGGNVVERAQSSAGLTKGVVTAVMKALSEDASVAVNLSTQTFDLVNGMLFDLAALTMEPNFSSEFRGGLSTLREAQEARQQNEGNALTSSGVQVLRAGYTMEDLEDLGYINK